jgi:hypothetical protein
MTPEGLRQQILAGIDKVLESPWVLRWITSDNRQLLRAERDYWQSADVAQLSVLLAFYNKEPS